MAPNDQYPYYYNSNAADQTTQNYYTGYESRTNQYNQHSRQSSSSTPAQNYNYQQQNAYDNDQTQQYNNQSYYANAHDGGQRAAETLSRMGSTTTNPSSTASAYNQGQTANSYNANYNSGSTATYSSPSTLQNQTSTYPTQSSYSTASAQQARSNSVNSAQSGMTSRSPVVEPTQQPRENVSTQYSRAQMTNVQRSAGLAQIQASHQLQRLADQRIQEASQTIPQTNQQTFVDPSAVYDPWPEYQRKLAAARAAKEAEDRAAAEREGEEKRQEEEKAAAEEAERRLQQEEEKQRKKEEAARSRAAKKDADPSAQTKKRKSKGAAAAEAHTATAATAGGLNLAQLTTMAGAAPAGSDAEVQIRQLMAMVKQMNDKHPDLLAKIWEEERQQHLEKSTADTPAAPTEGTSSAPKKKKTPKKVAAVATASVVESWTALSQLPAAGADTQPKAQSKAPPKSKAAPPATSSNGASASTPAPAQAKSTAQANNAAARGTIWPPEKKGQVAAAAVRWLSTLRGNHRRPSVTAQQIATMLDRNPTYIELCEMIEQLGFKVERAAFAKTLLTSVPDVNANRSAASPAIPHSPSTGPLRTPTAPSALASTAAPSSQAFSRPPVPTVTSPTEHRLLGMQIPANSSPYFDAHGEQIPTEKPVKAKTSRDKQQKRKVSENKKEESMDVESNRPSETPGPVTKAEAARKRTFADLVDLTALSEDDDLPPAKQACFGPPAVTISGQAYSTTLDFLPNFDGPSVIDPYLQRSVDKFGHDQQSPPSFERQQMMVVATKLNTMELAKPIDKRNALRRSKYAVRTLARDVLLATGKHPELLPLNGHLEHLRTIFASSISFNTDLATVRWDLIDPGEPVPEALATIVDDMDSVINDADDESDEDVRHFAVSAPSRTQFIAIGASDSPGGAVLELDSPTFGGLGRGKLVPSRGRGRPRGRPTRFARFSTGGAQTPIGNHQAPAPNSASPAAGSPGYSSFARETRPDGTKRRGRPVGWRKHLHQRGLGIEAGGPGYTYASASKPAPPPPVADPKFTVYKCRWQGCTAELHNLQTLRRHVSKKHGVPDRSGKFSCLWSKCGRQVQHFDAVGAVVHSIQHFDFPDTTELITHVEHRHIQPIGWELGDGPPGGFSDSNASDAEAYLSDRHGRRVTPTIPAAAPSSASANSSAQRPAGQRGRPPKKSDEEKARENQAELATRKREVGLGVDREGATFANEKRRAGFVDDEEGNEVLVDAS